MAKLAQAYLHLSINMSLSDREAYAEFLRATALELSREVYGISVEIEADSAEGSTKFWVTAAAGLAAAIVAYGDFRSGVDYLIRDARVLSERVLHTVEDSGIARDEIDVFQRRLGVVGKIDRVLRALDRLERGEGHFDPSSRHAEYSRLKAILFEVLTELDAPEDREYLLAQLPDALSKPVEEEDQRRQIPKLPQFTGSKREDEDLNAANNMTYQVKVDSPHSITYEPLVTFDPSNRRIVRPKKVGTFQVLRLRDES